VVALALKKLNTATLTNNQAGVLAHPLLSAHRLANQWR
jgi:hypothetical protein